MNENVMTTQWLGKPILLVTFLEEMQMAVYNLRFMIGFIIVLIGADLWFGCKAGVKRGEKLRFSRAGRRTLNKFADYLCFLILGAFLGFAITEPLGLMTHTETAAMALGFGCVFELDSIVDHVCEIKGKEKYVMAKGLILALLNRKKNGLGEAIEYTLKKEKR